MCLLTLDPTSVCVVLLVLTLVALWAYVTLAKERTQLPNLTSALREATQKSNNGQTGNKKASKSKWKRKQVDALSKDVQRVLPTVASTSDVGNGVKAQQLPMPKQVPQKTSDKDVVKRKQKNVKSGAGHALKGERKEGEWQTQLSRPQLRALRQKQRTGGQESQEPKNSVGTEGGSNTELQLRNERPVGVSGSTEHVGSGGSDIIVVASVSSSSTTSSSLGMKESSEPSADRVEEARPGPQLSTGMTSDPDPEQDPDSVFLASVSEVETALFEAARSSVSSIEEEKSSAVTTKKSQKKRKSRRKNKQGETVAKSKVQVVEIAAADITKQEADNPDKQEVDLDKQEVDDPDNAYIQEEWVVI